MIHSLKNSSLRSIFASSLFRCPIFFTVKMVKNNLRDAAAEMNWSSHHGVGVGSSTHLFCCFTHCRRDFFFSFYHVDDRELNWHDKFVDVVLTLRAWHVNCGTQKIVEVTYGPIWNLTKHLIVKTENTWTKLKSDENLKTKYNFSLKNNNSISKTKNLYLNHS